MECFEESTIEIVLGFLPKKDVQCSQTVLDTVVPLAFLKSGYIMRGYTPMMRGVDLEVIFIKELTKYERKFHRVLATGSFGSFFS